MSRMFEERGYRGDSMKLSNNNFSSIEQMSHRLNSVVVHERSNESDTNVSFFEVLQKTSTEQEALKFSKHASERLNDRNILLTPTQMERLVDGTQKAREKGVKESLVCVDDFAFIVNVKNNTVVTALNQEDDKVFTNIDGAVIV